MFRVFIFGALWRGLHGAEVVARNLCIDMGRAPSLRRLSRSVKREVLPRDIPENADPADDRADHRETPDRTDAVLDPADRCRTVRKDMSEGDTDRSR